MGKARVLDTIRRNLWLLWLLFCVALMPLHFSSRLHRWWHFKQVENEFQREVDFAVVQELATNILGQHFLDRRPPYFSQTGATNSSYSYAEWAGTNVPPDITARSREILRSLNWPTVRIKSDHISLFGGSRGQPE